jgi:hypothetical protein
VSLIKFHRVLIVTFILLCGVLGWVLWKKWQQGADSTALVGAVACVVVGIGAGFYVRSVGKKPTR